MKTNQEAIAVFCDVEGYDSGIEAYQDLQNYIDMPNGICMNDDCGFTETVEEDCGEGYCDECESHTVKSLALLLEII